MITMQQINEKSPLLPEARLLYNSAFPRNERMSFSELISDDSGASEVFSFLDDDEFIGLASLLTHLDITHILYLAVVEGKRDRGYGSKILELIHEKKTGQRIIVDIEMPEDDARNEEQRIKRKGFYLRNGYKETPVTYNWAGVDYEILSFGGSLTKKEFWDFWKAYR